MFQNTSSKDTTMYVLSALKGLSQVKESADYSVDTSSTPPVGKTTYSVDRPPPLLQASQLAPIAEEQQT
jgi:hypothetical protein